MYYVDMYAKVRRFCFVEGHSSRHASRVFGLSRAMVRKMLTYSEPSGYRRNQPIQRPVLGPFTDVIDAILEDDTLCPKKQRHTAQRIFDRIRDEHSYPGK